MMLGVANLLLGADRGDIMEILIGISVTLGAAGVGWGVSKLRRLYSLPERVDEMQSDLVYLRSRLDEVYTALINR